MPPAADHQPLLADGQHGLAADDGTELAARAVGQDGKKSSEMNLFLEKT